MQQKFRVETLFFNRTMQVSVQQRELKTILNSKGINILEWSARLTWFECNRKLLELTRFMYAKGRHFEVTEQSKSWIQQKWRLINRKFVIKLYKSLWRRLQRFVQNKDRVIIVCYLSVAPNAFKYREIKCSIITVNIPK